MKRAQAIEIWLESYSKSQAKLAALAGAGTLLLSLFVLALTWGVLYIIALLSLFALGMYPFVPWIATGLLIALFVTHAVTDRSHWERIEVSPKAYLASTLFLPAGHAQRSNLMFLDHNQAGYRVIINVLLTGPRIVGTGLAMLRRARRFGSVDRHACAEVLALLHRRSEKVPLEEVLPVIPVGRDPNEILAQILSFEGVLLLQSTPVGLSLMDAFHDEISAVIDSKKKRKKREQHE